MRLLVRIFVLLLLLPPVFGKKIEEKNECKIQFGLFPKDRFYCSDKKLVQYVRSEDIASLEAYFKENLAKLSKWHKDYHSKILSNEKKLYEEIHFTQFDLAKITANRNYEKLFVSKTRIKGSSRYQYRNDFFPDPIVLHDESRSIMHFKFLENIPGLLWISIKERKEKVMHYLLQTFKNKNLVRLGLRSAQSRLDEQLVKLISNKYLDKTEVVLHGLRNSQIKMNLAKFSRKEKMTLVSSILEEVDQSTAEKMLDRLFENGLKPNEKLNDEGDNVLLLLLKNQRKWILNFYRRNSFSLDHFDHLGRNFRAVLIETWGRSKYSRRKIPIYWKEMVTKKLNAIEYAWKNHFYVAYSHFYSQGGRTTIEQLIIEKEKQSALIFVALKQFVRIIDYSPQTGEMLLSLLKKYDERGSLYDRLYDKHLENMEVHKKLSNVSKALFNKHFIYNDGDSIIHVTFSKDGIPLKQVVFHDNYCKIQNVERYLCDFMRLEVKGRRAIARSRRNTIYFKNISRPKEFVLKKTEKKTHIILSDFGVVKYDKKNIVSNPRSWLPPQSQLRLPLRYFYQTLSSFFNTPSSLFDWAL